MMFLFSWYSDWQNYVTIMEWDITDCREKSFTWLQFIDFFILFYFFPFFWKKWATPVYWIVHSYFADCLL